MTPGETLSETRLFTRDTKQGGRVKVEIGGEMLLEGHYEGREAL